MSIAASFKFFLGGIDLEMVTIRELLRAQGVDFEDVGLSWGAKASSYAAGIHNALAAGQKPVLVELTLDLPATVINQCHIIDHHGPAVAKIMPTSLEQVFELLQLPPGCWSRHFDLVAANDRGHIRALRRLVPPPTDAEIRVIREADRQSIGLTSEDAIAAQKAIPTSTLRCEGRLTLIRSDARPVLIAEYLDPFFGGPGFQNLLVIGHTTVCFFGEQACVDRLVGLSPESPFSWSGGGLPDFGYWGAESSRLEFDPVADLESFLESDLAGS